jgi:hypothetical protein
MAYQLIPKMFSVVVLKGDLKDLLLQHLYLADTSQGKVSWNRDALTRILGEEKPGHVHGLGLVPNPDKVLDCSKLGRLKKSKCNLFGWNIK